MHFSSILFGTMTVMGLYFNFWHEFDQNGILFMILMMSWGITIYTGLRVFVRFESYLWVLIPIACFSLIMSYSRDMIIMNLIKNGMPTAISDDLFYVTVGRQFADYVSNGDLLGIMTIQTNQPGYMYVLGLMFLLLPSIIAPEVIVLSAVSLNMLLLSITTLLLMRYMLEREVGSAYTLLLGLAFASYPALMTVAAVARKDIIIVFLCTLLYIMHQEYRKQLAIYKYLILSLIIFLLALFRLPLGAFIMAMIIVDIVVIYKNDAEFIENRKSLAIFFSLLFLCFVMYTAYLLNYSSVDNSVVSNLEAISTAATDEATSGMRISALFVKIPIIGPPLWILAGDGLATIIPRNWIATYSTSDSYMLAINFLAKLTDIMLICALVRGIFAKGIFSVENHRLLIIIIGMSIFIGWAGIGVATEMRHKTMMLPFMLLLTSFTIFKNKKHMVTDT